MTTDNAPLPFQAGDFNSNASMIADEIVDAGIERGDELFEDLTEFLAEIEGLDRGISLIHFFHRLTRNLIDNGLDAKDLIAAVRKIKREAVKRRKIEAYAARLV
jgi:hypothetical protein